MTVIDIHTHMLTLDWIELLRAHGGGKYSVKKTPRSRTPCIFTMHRS